MGKKEQKGEIDWFFCVFFFFWLHDGALYFSINLSECCYFPPTLIVVLFSMQPIKSLHVKPYLHKALISAFHNWQIVTLTNNQTAACYTRATDSEQHPTLGFLLNSPPYLTREHEHTSCPAPQLLEQATKQTFTREKSTANVSLQVR